MRAGSIGIFFCASHVHQTSLLWDKITVTTSAKDISQLIRNTTRPTCTCRVDVGDTVALECPSNTSTWERDGQTVCNDSICTLEGLKPDELGLYTCAENEVVLIAGIRLCFKLMAKIMIDQV